MVTVDNARLNANDCCSYWRRCESHVQSAQRSSRCAAR